MGRGSKTKDRIVTEALSAFNTLRYANVTTAMLADRLGMAEGNLWYHFRTKRDLLDAIQARFVTASGAHLAAVADIADPVDAYIAYLRVWRDLFAQYAFMFRDRADYGAHSPDMAAALPALYDAIEAAVTGIYTRLTAQGLLDMAPDDAADFILNGILITRYYMEFQDERQNAQAPDPAKAITQHLTLLKGRLDPGALQKIRSALSD